MENLSCRATPLLDSAAPQRRAALLHVSLVYEYMNAEEPLRDMTYNSAYLLSSVFLLAAIAAPSQTTTLSLLSLLILL